MTAVLGATAQALKAGTHQSVAFTGTAGTISNAVGSRTRIVRIISTEACYIAFGSAPTATTSDMLLPADQVEYFTMVGAEKVSAVQVATGGTLHVTEMS